MKKHIFIFSLVATVLLIVLGCAQKEHSKFDFTGQYADSKIRGFNYTPANVKSPRHHIESWVNYDSATTVFDINLAKSLNLNQARVFIPYDAFVEDSEGIPARLKHFVRECDKRGIGVMPVIGYGPWLRDSTQMDKAVEWVRFLVKTLSNEPGLAMWDVMNEPDWPPAPKEWVKKKSDAAIFLSKKFHELDPNTSVTIGCAFVDGMIDLADYVDVLQFHDYSQTREQIRDNIKRAKEFAARVNKPLINGELGCIARANPYDVTLEEHIKANVGWYIWELMIVREGWGIVHGVFYDDGTIRDPSIPAAMMGFFRKRSGDIIVPIPDKEGWIAKIIEQSEQWLRSSDKSWEEGLEIAETSANLLESGELCAMNIPPTYQVASIRNGNIDINKLKELILAFKEQLEPYKIDQTKN